MIDFKIEKEGRVKTIFINSGLTIQSAEALKDVLVESLKETDHIVLDLNSVTEVDLSCLQLLCSAHKTYRDLNRKFTLSTDSTEVFFETVKAAGFQRHMGCESECYKSCLWSNCK